MPAVTVENVWKQYRYGRLGYGTLRHDLQSWWAAARGRPDPNAKISAAPSPGSQAPAGDRFWALEDVSFTVEQGEVVGVIGRNGAGKSTLLKVMSRVTSPTRGVVRLTGRLASLLEVGTGFHPDLTGRENVFLNGAILGMTRAEVRRKFDEIVAFAEVERFIDTPVKRYSSGMYVRLAFAVAAHLEPEILVVDEVLAVGDAEFQAKCLGKMKEVSGEGRTVLFVSHNMGAISNLCDRCALFEKGRVHALGSTVKVVDEYLNHNRQGRAELRVADGKGAGRAWFSDAFVEDLGGRRATSVSVQEAFRVVMDLDCAEALRAVEAGVKLERRDGQTVFISEVCQTQDRLDLPQGRTRLSVTVPGAFLAPGTYHLSFALHRPNVEIIAALERLLTLNIVETGSAMWKYSGVDVGPVLVRFPWNISHSGAAEVPHRAHDEQ